jgi:hypothetical protein
VGGDAHGLVHDDDGLVLEEDPHARHRLRDDLQRLLRLGHLHVEAAAGGHAIRLPHHAAVHRDSPRLRDLRGLGAGEAQRPRERGVDPLPVEALGDEQ